MHGFKGDCIKITEPSSIKANRTIKLQDDAVEEEL